MDFNGGLEDKGAKGGSKNNSEDMHKYEKPREKQGKEVYGIKNV